MKPTTPTIGGGKGTESLPRLQGLVYGLFARGGKYSAADVSIRLHLSDPRGHISKLRAKGIAVLDEWRKSEHGTRYKVYFLKQEGV